MSIDEELAQVFRRYSARKLLEQYREHCANEAAMARQDGYTGRGWEELHDQIEDILPAVIDDQLVGDEIEQAPTLTPGQVFARSHAPGRW
jgi:hypothetical protein